MLEKETLKLFVWNNPYVVDSGHSMLIVMAHNEQEARELATEGKSYHFGDLEQDNVPMLVNDLGPPTRVVEGPCAEWHECSE